MESRYPPHGTYQASGIESCPMRPEHWDITRLKFISELNPSKSQVAHWDPLTTVTFLPMEAIGENGELDVSQERTLQDVRSGYTFLGEGDVCIAKITPCFENGKGAVISGTSNGVAFATTEVIPFRCVRSKDARFLYYLLTSAPFKPDAEASMYGAGGQKRVADSFAANYSVVLPPPVERTQIAKFLDYETAKIDALIEKQQQLIALLKEKRQAVISHAVTKGLNPDAPMRDSGVEWLGEVPKHWEVTRLKYTKSKRRNAFVDGPFGSNLKSEHFLDDGTVLVIESGFATSGELQEETLKRISEQHFATISRSEAREGDIIIAKIGARYGMSSILPSLSSKAVVSGNSLKLSVDSETMSTDYAHALLGVLKVCGAMDDDVNVTAQPALSLGGLNNLLFLRPPLSEQTAIVTELETRRGKLDSLIVAALSLAETLAERRTALISAAVTGKIDVRGWKPPESKSQTEAA